jgi:hypothetical protein
LISLDIACGRNSSDYQVNLEGSKGTAKFQMTHLTCAPKYRYSKWFHGAFADEDIGELQRVSLMVCINFMFVPIRQ